jgi:acetolactate synthase regulatory subunit
MAVNFLIHRLICRQFFVCKLANYRMVEFWRLHLWQKIVESERSVKLFLQLDKKLVVFL